MTTKNESRVKCDYLYLTTCQPAAYVLQGKHRKEQMMEKLTMAAMALCFAVGAASPAGPQAGGPPPPAGGPPAGGPPPPAGGPPAGVPPEGGPPAGGPPAGGPPAAAATIL